MKNATIIGFEGSWGSGVATLVLKQGRKTVRVYCENGATVRALASIFPEVIGAGHTVNVAALKGQRIRYALDDMGLMLGAIAPAL